MYDLSGIIYRIWGMGILLSAIGLAVVLLSFFVKVDELQKRFFVGGIVFLVLGIGIAVKYISILRNPEVLVFEGYFNQEHRNSRVAPPLPLTWEYNFLSEDGNSMTFYIDVNSKKKIFDEDFEKSMAYRIYYEDEHKIIVKVEPLKSIIH